LKFFSNFIADTDWMANFTTEGSLSSKDRCRIASAIFGSRF
jgi:hypothetical protein